MLLLEAAKACEDALVVPISNEEATKAGNNKTLVLSFFLSLCSFITWASILSSEACVKVHKET